VLAICVGEGSSKRPERADRWASDRKSGENTRKIPRARTGRITAIKYIRRGRHVEREIAGVIPLVDPRFRCRPSSGDLAPSRTKEPAYGVIGKRRIEQ
jgi:hypothetical protein